MIFKLFWIPEFSYFENKIENPFNLDKGFDFIQQQINNDGIYQSNETLFWTLVLLYQLDKLNLVNKDNIKNYISDLKHQDGGYKSSTYFEKSDTWNTFYCIASLKLLGFDEEIEDQDVEFIINSQSLGSGSDGGFIHCQSKNCHVNCNGKTSIKSSFYALSTLSLLNKLDKIDKEQLLKYLKRNSSDDLEPIYQIFSLKILNEKEIINFEKKISLIPTWQIPESGISKKFPSIKNTYWTVICLGLLEKLELIEFEEMFDFLKIMQYDNGGFTEQYTGISSQKPNILSTVLGFICISYIWDKLIDGIENEILFKARISSDIYFAPICKKFSVPSKLVKKIANWLISNKWINGKIYDSKVRFQDFFDEQYVITQEIIKKIIKLIKSNLKQEELNLSEFSKRLDFSNALERVKLVINDLIIKEFLISNIESYKKKYILKDFLLLEEYLHLLKPIPYTVIINEKKRIEKAKHELLTLHTILTEFLQKSSEDIQRMIDQEKTFDAQVKLNQIYEFIRIKIQMFEGLIIQIKSNHRFVNSKLLHLKYEKSWPSIKSSIEESLSTFKSYLEEKIKKKGEFITKRTETAEDQEAIKTLEDILTKITKKSNQYQVELQNFFQNKYTDHKATIKLIEAILGYIEKLDSILSSKISELLPKIHFKKFTEEVDKIKKSWMNKRKEPEENLKLYQKIIEKRDELKKFITERASKLQKFSDDNNTLIIDLMNGNKLQESSDLLNESINNFNKLFSQQYKVFNEIMNKVNQEILEFPNFSNDIILDWNKTLKDKENKWNNIILKLREKLHSNTELVRKDELDKKLKYNIENIKNLIENLQKDILKLIETKKLADAGNKTNEMSTEISQKIKIYNQDFNNFIKTSITEFKTFSETVNDLIENWDENKENLTQYLNEITQKLETRLDNALSAKKKADMYKKKEELDEKLKDNIADIEKLIENMKKDVSELIETKKLTEAKNKTKEMYTEISQKIKIYDQDFKNFIKKQLFEFKIFTETVNDLIENWDKKKKNLTQILNEIREDIKNRLDKNWSAEKKEELRELIKTQISNLENSITRLDLKYNLILKSGKNLDENESKFRTEHSQIRSTLRSLDNQIKNFIKSNSRIYDSFNKISVEEEKFWNTTRLSMEKKLELVFDKTSDDFFIKNVQFIVSAFKGKKIELSYLSKVMKIKPKPLKLKLITLISNSKLNGQLDSSSDTFILTDGMVPEGYPGEEIELFKEVKVEKEGDLIKRDLLILRYLMVIHYRVGASVYSRRLGHWEMDSDLIGGFLTAMQDFSAEIKKKRIPMKRMEYKEFEILIEQGKYVFVALFIDGKESDWIRKKLQAYVKKFEKYFESNLVHWKGELRSFSNSGFLVDEVFELYRV
jgi:prenyltransferase beta subunit/DNA repair exonuclease SbcCD ATPase subunit